MLRKAGKEKGFRAAETLQALWIKVRGNAVYSSEKTIRTGL